MRVEFKIKKVKSFSLIMFCLGLFLGSPVFAQSKSKKAEPSREKLLRSEKIMKSKGGDKSSSKLDFDSLSIGGERKAPLGSLIGQTKSDKDFDFVKIRMHWHPEMVQSATVLDSSSR
ncbi:MAG: hypothetical protein KBD78_10955 [Oligoflexales bacterium]|nr:hypothetical protein [Oligoflexales bacterium]